jgi:hypothetical protein
MGRGRGDFWLAPIGRSMMTTSRPAPGLPARALRFAIAFRPVVACRTDMLEFGVDWRDYLRCGALFPWQNFGMVS